MALEASSTVNSRGTPVTARRGMSFGTLGPFFALAFGMNGPAWPDAQPWDTLMFAIAAVVIVRLNRQAMLTPDGAVTEVLLPGNEG